MELLGQWLLNVMLIGFMIIPCCTSEETLTIQNAKSDEPLQNRTISIVGKNFLLDGIKQLHIVSGELHYFRTPAAYWKELLTKLKLAGLNSVCTSVEWSFHEPEERQYYFSGDRDVALFIRTAAEVGLYVLLRVGPYIGAERDLGGLPYWLLGKYDQIRLRSLDEDYIFETRNWFEKLFEHLSPLLYGNGGPIILVQIENELRTYAYDEKYLLTMSELTDYHVKNKALLYSADLDPRSPDSTQTNTSIAVINIGPGVRPVSTAVEKLNKSDDGLLMNVQLYTGWFSEWGQPSTYGRGGGSTITLAKSLAEYLDQGAHVNLYMLFGGTNFEFTSGANINSGPKAFTPILTSYDCDAPLDEAGDPTEKYFAIRQVLQKYFAGVKSLPQPVARERGVYGKVSMKPILGLLSKEGRSMLSTTKREYYGGQLPTFEALRQRSGLVLYELNVTSTLKGKKNLKTNHIQFRKHDSQKMYKRLHIEKPGDLVYVFVNGIKYGNISRMNSKHHLLISTRESFTLSLLVENQGRVRPLNNYENYRKGILSKIKLNYGVLSGIWSVTGFNLENFNHKGYNNSSPSSDATLSTIRGPVLYEGFFQIPETPRNTFLNTEGWGKGIVWINGYNLGRYWSSVGPQTTLFVPGVWLKAAPEKNVVQILELQKPSKRLTVEFVPKPKEF